MSVMLLDQYMIGFITAAAFELSDGYGFYFESADGVGRSFAESEHYKVARLLWAENVAAYAGRYRPDVVGGDSFGEIEPQHIRRWAPVDMVEVFKALDCYEYQASEAPHWRTSNALAIVARVRKLAGQALAGYDAAAWGDAPAAYMQGAKS